MLVGLNRKELKKVMKEAFTELMEEEKAERDELEFVDLEEEEDDDDDGFIRDRDLRCFMDEGECFPIMLAKGHVSFDGKFKTSYILKDARDRALDFFCAFMDETDYDVDKMIAIADFYEDLLRRGEIGKLHGNYHEARNLAGIHFWRFDLMEALATREHENEHRLYIVTLTERFCELVRYLEMLKDGGKTDFSDIDEDYGFLHLAWKYDEDVTPAISNMLIDGMLEQEEETNDGFPTKFVDFFLNVGREPDEGDYDWEDLIDEEENTDDDAPEDYDCYEEMYADIDGLEEGVSPEEGTSDDAESAEVNAEEAEA